MEGNVRVSGFQIWISPFECSVQFDFDSCRGVEKSCLWLLGNGRNRVLGAGMHRRAYFLELGCQNSRVLVGFGRWWCDFVRFGGERRALVARQWW